MTSQIAVFNLECVAVASDSVMTISNGRQERTLSSSEKVFDLGPAHKVVAVSSGEARFMKVPWTVLLREWQTRLAEPLATVGDYAGDLVDWLAGQGELFTDQAQEEFYAWQLRDYYSAVRAHIGRELADRDLEDAAWDDVSVQACVTEVARGMVEQLMACADLDGIDAARDEHLIAASATLIEEAFDSVFDEVPRTCEADQLLKYRVPALILAKDEPFGTDSVIALIGYGTSDLFPGHQVVEFHGLVGGQVRCHWWQPSAVTPGRSAAITPLAQTDAIDTFLRAYHHDFLRQAHRTLDAVLDEHLPDADTLPQPPQDAVDDPVDTPDEDSSEDSDEDSDENCVEDVGGQDALPAREVPSGDPQEKAEESLTARQAAHRQLSDDFDELSWERFVSPMLATVEALPRVDMARMAEALVGIQALRAASMGSQPTVGGPIDVVVISRAHGVQWLRRKELILN